MKDSRLSRWRYLAIALSLIVVIAALVALHRILGEVHLSQVLSRFDETPLDAVLIALACTAASYLTLTGYDVTALWQIERPLPYRQTALASFISFAFTHNIGLAAVTGGSLRYRIYSAFGLSGAEVALLTAICAVTYGLGLAFLLGLALVLEPGRLARTDDLPLDVNQAAGMALLLAVLVYGLWTGLRTRPFSFKDWTVPPPSWRMSLSQLCIGAADVSFAAGALYVVLPSDLDVGFAAFVGIYVAAMTVGMLSHLPGAIGVFEAVMLLALPTADKGSLLGALLVYRCIYYFLPFGVATALLAWHEFRQGRAAVGLAVKTARDIAHAAVPQVVGAAVFAGGAVLLFSAATPTLGPRAAMLREVLPLPFVEASHLLSSVVGLLLLILAHGLVRRLDRAFHLTALLLGGGIAFSLLKGFDYKEAIVLAVVLLLLLASRHAFHRRTALLNQSFSPSWLLAIAAIVAASVWVGLFAYKQVEYADKLWWVFAYQEDAPRFLRASLVVAVLGIAFFLYLMLRPASPVEDAAEFEPDELESLVRNATTADAGLALMGDKCFLRSEDGAAFIMYQLQGRSWVALGDPIGPEAARGPLIWNFRELCERHRGWPVFYEVGEENLADYLDLGLAPLKLGEEARVDLTAFSLDGGDRRRLRHADRHLAKEGILFEVVPAERVPGILGELRAISDEWLAQKATHEKGFSIGAFSEAYLSHFDCAVARSGDRIVAFANLFQAPKAGELSIDLMRHRQGAPAGLMDFLFVELILWGKARGYKWFNLGMAPLSGLDTSPLAPAWHRIGTFVFRHGEHFYNFAGLRAYKEKFGPVWRPKYLMAPGNLALPRILFDVASLISGGPGRILRK